MKKALIILVLTMVSASWTQSMSQINGGFKMGIDFSNIKMTLGDGDFNKEFDTKRLISPRMGFFIRGYVYEGLFIQASTMFGVKGVRWDDERERNNKWVDSKEYQIILCLDIPVNVGYMFDLDGVKLFGMVGPVITSNMYTTNLYKADGEWDNEHHYIGTEITDTYKPWDFGINIEGGVQLSRFEFTAFYTQGLKNLSNFEGGNYKTNVFGFTAAILFGPVDSGRGGYRYGR